jgi:hypothetical protein
MLKAEELREAASHKPLTEALGVLTQWTEALSSDLERIDEIRVFFDSGSLAVFLASTLQRKTVLAAYRDKFLAFFSSLVGVAFAELLVDKLAFFAVLLDSCPSRRDLTEVLAIRLSETARAFRCSQTHGHESIASLDCLIQTCIRKKEQKAHPDFVRRLFEVRDAHKDLVQLTQQRLLALGSEDHEVHASEKNSAGEIKKIDGSIDELLTKGQNLVEGATPARRKEAEIQLKAARGDAHTEGSLQSLQDSTAAHICTLEQKRSSLQAELAQCNQQLETMREYQMSLDVRVADENMELERQLAVVAEGSYGDGVRNLMQALMDTEVHNSVTEALKDMDLKVVQHSELRLQSRAWSEDRQQATIAATIATTKDLVSRVQEYCRSEMQCMALMKKREVISCTKCDELAQKIAECRELGMDAAVEELEATHSKLQNMLEDDRQVSEISGELHSFIGSV